MSDPAWTLLTIAAVERETGIGKDTLRAWERRYGFPAPVRNERGDRAYTWAQVERLRRVNRLIAAGHRPGALMQMSTEALDDLARSEARASLPAYTPAEAAATAAPMLSLEECLVILRAGGSPAIRRWLMQALNATGLGPFVRDGLTPLMHAIGEGWVAGRLQVFEEHLVTEAVQAVLRHALLPLQAGDAPARPRVLLTTVPGEEHGLGTLMAEVLLTLAGAACVALGPSTPVADILGAARASKVDVVALGFSTRMTPARRLGALRQLRARLDPDIALWAGGAGVESLHVADPAGWLPLRVQDIASAVAAWRASTSPASAETRHGEPA